MRVCVDDKRPTLIDRAKGKMSPGIYMRDIAEVRGGGDSHDFIMHSKPPTNPDFCLSLIGTERTISLELPGKVIFHASILKKITLIYVYSLRFIKFDHLLYSMIFKF